MADVQMSVLAAQRPHAGPRVPAAAARARLFRETPFETASRWLLGAAYACHPKRAADLPLLLWWTGLDLARGGTRLPDPALTRTRPDTFAGVCRDISPESILAAARMGFFPWCHCGPLKWWTRTSRQVLFLNEPLIGRSRRRQMRRTRHRVTFDCAFDAVIKACAERRRGFPRPTWVTPQIMRLYAELHDLGHAHSFEEWSEDGRLIGGGYGLAVGRVFYGESQFTRETDGSKMAYATLVHHLQKWGYVLCDAKDYSPAMESIGCRPVPRPEFEALLKAHAHAGGKPGRWSVEDDLGTIAETAAHAAITRAQEE